MIRASRLCVVSLVDDRLIWSLHRTAIVLIYRLRWEKGGKGKKRTTKERREVRESETETERREQKRCKDLESQMVPCGLDFSCQSSVIWENQSHMS